MIGMLVAALLIAPPGEVVENLKSSFSLPLRNWIRPREDGKIEHPLRGVALAASYAYPLNSSTLSEVRGVGNQGEQRSSTPTATLSVKYSPLSYWFAQTTLYTYVNQQKQAPWNPDFSYTFGYDDWHPYTLSLTYSNYGGNRFRPAASRKETTTKFKEGTFSLGWKFKLPKAVERQLSVTDKGTMGWSVSYNVTPQFTNLNPRGGDGPKHSLTLSHRNTFYRNFYWNLTLYYYLNAPQQQTWNPDYTYGFGYSDSKPGGFSIQYNNYSGNRFPGRQKARGTGSFSNGGVSVSWNWAWAQ